MIQLFKPKYETEEILANIRTVLESGWTGTGPQCAQFEKNWNDYTGAKYSCFMHSATAALHIAVRLLDLPKGSKIVSPGLTFVSTNLAIIYEGHIPVFADINYHDLSLSFDDVKNKIKEHDAKAVIWVHYGGNSSEEFSEMMKYRDELGVKVIEDCAHAGGAFYRSGKRIGEVNGNIQCFSHQAVKNIQSFDGGTLCLPNQEMLDRTRRLAWMGIDKDTYSRTNSSKNELYKWQYEVNEIGWKYNGNDISAAILNVQIKYGDRDNAYRKQIYNWYKKGFEDCVNVDWVHQHDGSSFHLCVIRVNNREEVMAALRANGIAPGVHYIPNYEFKIFSEFYKDDCPKTEIISKQIISLPNHLNLTKQDVDKIIEVVNVSAK